MTVTRRDMLRSSITTVGLLGAARVFGQAKEFCETTPPQPEGPFYPVRNQADTNSDLTQVDGKSARALGTVVYVQGVVQDENCAPIANATVEIWQACATGRYNHPGDRENPSVLDPNFQYWGIATTNAQGEYLFKTIKPGHYLADENWMRPPHIHYKVHKLGFHELTTQLYFEGNEYNDGDLILRRLRPEERARVVVPLQERNGNERGQFDCRFDVTLVRVT